MNFLTRFRPHIPGSRPNIPLPALDASATQIFQSWHKFNPSLIRWMPLDPTLLTGARQRPSDTALPTPMARDSRLALVTWNVDAFGDNPEARISALISHVQRLSPDIVFLQEVSREALFVLLAMPWLRDSWYSSEAGPTNWEGLSFATMTLLSKSRFGDDACRSTDNAALGPVWRIKYPSRFGRDALCCDVLLPPPSSPTAPLAETAASASDSAPELTRVRLINVHLDSLPIQPSLRPGQLSTIAATLHAAGRGLMAGDFNPVLPEDDALVGENRLVDAWAALRPGDPGFTWGVDGKAPFPPGRLDKVAIVGLEACEIHVIHPGMLEAERERGGPLPWSDHSGLMCSFGLASAKSTPAVAT